MNTPAGQSRREIEQLKELLFQPESERITSVETDVEALKARVGTPSALESATANVLVNALRRAEIAQPSELAAAIAPSVVSAIRHELRNSRDAMVEALYPITGRLVSAAVANAFKELLEVLQARIDALTSTNQWKWRVRSLITGRPVSEIALAESQDCVIERLFLIERGSGRLLAIWHRDPQQTGNPELISGMIAAITEFATQALSGSGELRNLDFGGREIVLRASPRTLIAAEYRGTLAPQREREFDQAFMRLVDDLDHERVAGDDGLAALAGQAMASASAVRPQQKSSIKSKIILGGMAAALIGLVTWWSAMAVQRWLIERRVTFAHETFLAAHDTLQPYPIRLTFNHSAAQVVLKALIPDAETGAQLASALQLASAPYRVTTNFAVTPTLSRIEALESGLAVLKKQADKLQQVSTNVVAHFDAAPMKLAAFAAQNAIFFSNANEYRDSDAAGRTIEALAQLLRDNDLKIRIVGHTDETGSPSNNRQISQSRARVVADALIAQGVAAERIKVVGRASSMQISDTANAKESDNRRVTFEQQFPAESAN